MLAHPGAPSPDLLTVNEAADTLRMTERFIRMRIADGTLPALRVGAKAIRLRRADVEALLQPVGGEAA